MKQKKIVSIEDRIPKLKQARKKKANRRLIFYLSIFFVLIAVIVYLQSPLSNIKHVLITGNSFITEQEVIDKSELHKNTNIWTINKEKIEELVSEYPVIETVHVNRKLPWTVEIKLTEYERVGYVIKDSTYYPILENGDMLSAVQKPIGDAPLILEFTDSTYLNRMTSELKKLPKSILNLISEIYWRPTEENKNKVLLYMNDGFIVDGTIRNFSEKMKIYPSIASQLEPGSKGIIHIGVGAYFEKTDMNEEEESDLESEQKTENGD